jgi:hypothetical protein
MSSLSQATTGKLKPCYIGPYRIAELINDVAVRLDLPPQARIHDVFHVSALKKFNSVPPSTPPALPHIHHGLVTPEPARVERARLARGVRQLLVHWQGEPPESATWEDLATFRDQFPQFQLEDELLLEEGRDVMWGRTYARQRRACDIRRKAERAAARNAARAAVTADKDGRSGPSG